MVPEDRACRGRQKNTCIRRLRFLGCRALEMIIMAWPNLLKAKDNARSILLEIDKMLRDANSLNKKDIVAYKETMLGEIDKSAQLIEEELKDITSSLYTHDEAYEVASQLLSIRGFVRRWDPECA